MVSKTLSVCSCTTEARRCARSCAARTYSLWVCQANNPKATMGTTTDATSNARINFNSIRPIRSSPQPSICTATLPWRQRDNAAVAARHCRGSQNTADAGAGGAPARRAMLDTALRPRETRPQGKTTMATRFARVPVCRLALMALVAAGLIACAAPAWAQPASSQPTAAQPASSQPTQPSPLVVLEPFKFELDQIETAVGREGIGDDSLAELR